MSSAKQIARYGILMALGLTSACNNPLDSSSDVNGSPLVRAWVERYRDASGDEILEVQEISDKSSYDQIWRAYHSGKTVGVYGWVAVAVFKFEHADGRVTEIATDGRYWRRVGTSGGRDRMLPVQIRDEFDITPLDVVPLWQDGEGPWPHRPATSNSNKPLL